MRTKYRKRDESLKAVPMTIEPSFYITKESPIFTIGSCFALEIRNYLLGKGFNLLNKDLDEELIWYNTYTILYEFQRLSGEFYQEDDDLWKVKEGYQDPYRRSLFNSSPEKLLSIVRDIDDKIKKYIQEAELLIITLGLVEVWEQPDGKVICSCPGYPKGRGGGQHCSFKMTGYEENFDNMCKVVDILKQYNPKCNLLITTSPVPLANTFRNVDHLVANTESKSVLRSVCGALDRKYDNVQYYHSYELASHFDKKSVFKPDGRHVRPEFVAYIMQDFYKNFVK